MSSLVPRIFRNHPHREAAAVGLLAAATTVVAVGYALSTSPVVRILLIMISMIFVFGTLPLFWSIAMARMSGLMAAAGLAFINTVGLIGGFVGPYLFGIVEDATGNPSGGFYVVIAVVGHRRAARAGAGPRHPLRGRADHPGREARSRPRGVTAAAVTSRHHRVEGDSMNSVVITVGTTGAYATKANTPWIPTTPEEIAAEATAAYEAGASVVSVHLRDADQRPTADLDIARRTMDLIREQSPILIQLSTGVSPDATFEERLALVELRPRMATLSPCTMTFNQYEFRNPPDFVRRLAGRMRELGVKPELEIYDTGHVDAAIRLLDEGLLEAPLQFGIVMGVRGGMTATPENLLHVVRSLPPGSVWQSIGIGKANFDFAAMAMTLGGNARTGLEDNLYLRRGELSPGNAPLVSRVADIARALDRPLATVEETEKILGLAAQT